MGELRDRMVRDMDVRHFSEHTVEAYVAGVKGLAKYYLRPPDQLSDEEVQRYLLHLRDERKLSGSTCNQIRCALRFFYEVTVRRPQASLTVPPMRQAQKLPEILSREEVERILGATRTLRERVLLMGTYGGGLRVSEVVRMTEKPSYIMRSQRRASPQDTASAMADSALHRHDRGPARRPADSRPRRPPHDRPRGEPGPAPAGRRRHARLRLPRLTAGRLSIPPRRVICPPRHAAAMPRCALIPETEACYSLPRVLRNRTDP